MILKFKSRNLVVSIPFAFYLALVFLPFIMVFFISLTEAELSVPPYTPIVSLEDNKLLININFYNYIAAFTDSVYFGALLSSLKFSLITTLLCLLVGYPVAYCISQSKPSARNTLLLLVMLPMWLSFLVRVYSWIAMLGNDGFINQALIWLGVISEPLMLYRTNFSVYLVMVVSYLPLMIIPIYNCLIKIDPTLIEAAHDLGASPFVSLFRITIPLSVSGVVAGCLLVFIPSMGEYVIPQLMGGSNTLMLGKVIWQEFFSNLDWPMTSAITCLMIVVLLLPLALLNRRALARESP